jgi:hypothetical protein
MFPKLTDIEPTIVNNIVGRKRDPLQSTNLMPWIRVISGAVVGKQPGLIMVSNNDLPLFAAAGVGSIYGSSDSVGSLGYDFNGNFVAGGSDRGLRPSPTITDFSISEGKDQISREASLNITCYSLEQMEHIQDYFMEPGYSLCVEWGWNTTMGAIHIVSSKDKSGKQLTVEGFVSNIADSNLDYNKLHIKRTGAQGDYDSFLGFIVGGSVGNEGEQFNVTVKLRGAPGLPTFLQSHTRINEKSRADGTIIDSQTTTLFQTSEMNESEKNSALRRWRRTFNELPAPRQIKNVKELANTVGYSKFDFINLDDVINKAIQTFAHPSFWTDGFSAWKQLTVDGVEISREKLASKNRYIRFKVAMDILNANGNLDAYVVGDKKITIKIDIDKSKIGAFPYMFSTKASALLIPGSIPDFTPYFLNASAKIRGAADGYIFVDGVATPPIPEEAGSFNGITFVQNKALDEDGLKENKGYWGYLKDLYINLDMFNSKLSQTNKNVREILIDILNEMTAAVNSFWNFQVVESMSGDNVVLTVCDENWIGQKPTDGNTFFYHNGIYSPFLESTLDLSLPGEMVNQIVCNRLSLATQPDAPSLSTNETSFFNSDTDLFINKVVINGTTKSYSELGKGTGAGGEGTPPPEEKKIRKSETIQTEIDKKQTQAIQLQSEVDALGQQYRDINDTINKLGSTDAEIAQKDKLKIDKEAIAEKQRKKQYEELVPLNTEILKLKDEKKVEESKEVTEAQEAKKAAVNQNIAKVDIMPYPLTEELTLGTDILDNAGIFNGIYRIYCYDDTSYLDLLRKSAFEGNGTLSHPLPIKYTFKILGSSGIRRGDTFNITGIPKKYSDNGLFQVTKVEHSVTGMEWNTTITGEYRQKQGSTKNAAKEKDKPANNEAEVKAAEERKKLENGTTSDDSSGYVGADVAI